MILFTLIVNIMFFTAFAYSINRLTNTEILNGEEYKKSKQTIFGCIVFALINIISLILFLV